jgi:hypothetical protein
MTLRRVAFTAKRLETIAQGFSPKAHNRCAVNSTAYGADFILFFPFPG